MSLPVSDRDRIVGCIVGGALGDAWGGAYEGAPGPIEFRAPITSRVSDDTQLTLATCEAIVRCGEARPEDVAESLLAWFKAGRVTGVGSSTLKALRDLAAGAHWALSGARGERTAGNGAAMRAAPLAFVLDPANEGERTLVRDIARITHHNDEAYVGALAVVAAVRSGFRGTWPSSAGLQEVVDRLPEYSEIRERLEELVHCDLSPVEVAQRFGSTGWVVESVPLALHAARGIETHSLATVLRRSIEAGGDTDTVASITGQIAGASVGIGAIENAWLHGIQGLDSILAAAERFADIVST